MERNQYGAIDITKFIFSILIVMLHAQQKSNIYPDIHSAMGASFLFVFELVCRLAVPFFFITSSYFLFKGAKSPDETKQRVFKYIKRLLILYVVWFVINIPYIIFGKLGIPNSISLKLFIKLVRDIVFCNGFPASWYLMASMVDAWIIWFLTKNQKNVAAIVLSIFCYCICLLMTFYNFLVCEPINEVFIFVNKLFKAFYLSFPYGLIYFVIGKLLAENEKKIKIKTNIIAILFVCAFILLFVELFGFMYLYPGFSTCSHTTYFMLPAVSALVVLLCLKIKLPNSQQFIQLRKSSTIIYCSHGLVQWIFGQIIEYFKIETLQSFLILFFVTIVVCIVISVALINMSTKHKLLKYFY